MKKRIHIRVYGIVQGVAFRYYTVATAKRLNLQGWVRNVPDGSVEILAEGEESELNELLQWAKRGPSSAVVEKVEYNWETYTGEFEDFYIKY